jgi:putative nucleotidyltransferase with HDIG domain
MAANDPIDFLDLNCKVGEALFTSLKHRDEYTQSHCERVANIATLCGQQLGMTKSQLDQLKLAAIFHDIGKIGIPDQILLNTGKLTDEEYAIMKAHVSIGANIVEKLDIEDAQQVADIILYHHEHFDGSGYPHQLKADDIPIASRIICITDVYDALSSRRCYRVGISPEQALDKMHTEMHHMFDPEILDIFSTIALEP